MSSPSSLFSRLHLQHQLLRSCSVSTIFAQLSSTNPLPGGRSLPLLLLVSIQTSSLHSANTLFAFDVLCRRFFCNQSNNDRLVSTSKASELDRKLDHTEVSLNDDGKGAVDGDSDGCEESCNFPVRALISLLDGYHDLTSIPWWIVIASSTVAMRLSLFPLLIVQLLKLEKISKLFPKLPRPFPLPFSGKSYVDQFLFFQKERRAVGCPSYLWSFAYFSVQVPCFLLWMASIRRMSLDHHPGFDCGGTLWFQNLTEFPNGLLGSTCPLLVAGLHFINVQISFNKASVQNLTGILGLLAKYYKFYLDLLTLPLFVIGFCIPQGSLVYWVANSSLTVIQQLSLKNPVVRATLGLSRKASSSSPVYSEERRATESALDPDTKLINVPAESLSPKQLLALSVQLLADDHKDRAMVLLKLALEKSPDNVEALIVLGQTLLQKKQLVEATEYLERAISKLVIHVPSSADSAYLLILASQWAGVSCIRQRKSDEGIAHLERIAAMKEPEDHQSKERYFYSLVLLASALWNENRRAEAVKYLRMAVAYDANAYKHLLEQCEEEEDFVGDLVNSRRGDY